MFKSIDIINKIKYPFDFKIIDDEFEIIIEATHSIHAIIECYKQRNLVPNFIKFSIDQFTGFPKENRINFTISCIGNNYLQEKKLIINNLSKYLLLI